MKKSYCVCLGESKVAVPWKEKKRLNNEKLTRYMMHGFIYFLLMNKEIEYPVRTTFSKKNEKKYWGVAYQWCRSIILYRHSVWVFLHELAHVCAPPDSAHDYRFAKKLRELYHQWKEFKKGCNNCEKKGDFS